MAKRWNKIEWMRKDVVIHSDGMVNEVVDAEWMGAFVTNWCSRYTGTNTSIRLR